MRTSSIFTSAAAIVLGAGTAGCTEEKPLYCYDDSDCNLYASTSACVVTNTGRWCAYSDSTCPGTYLRFVEDLENDHAAQCVASRISIVSISPAHGDTGVDPLQPIVAELPVDSTWGIAVDPTLRLTCGSREIAGASSYDVITHRVEFAPEAALPLGASCRITLTAQLDDEPTPVPQTYEFSTRAGRWGDATSVSAWYVEALAAAAHVVLGPRGDALVQWPVASTGGAGMAWASRTRLGEWTASTQAPGLVAGIATSLDVGVGVWRQRASAEGPWTIVASPVLGRPWMPHPTPLGAADTAASDPVLATSGRDTAIAAWIQSGPRGQQIVASRYHADVGVWDAPVAIDRWSTTERSPLRLVALGAGRFMLVWMAPAEPGPGFHVMGSILDALGWSDPAAISEETSGDPSRPDVAGASAGVAVVAWRRGLPDGAHEIRARMFGVLEARTHVLSEPGHGDPDEPRVLPRSDGTMTAVWTHQTSTGRQLWLNEIGTAVGAPVRVTDHDDVRWFTVLPDRGKLAWSACDAQGRAAVYVGPGTPTTVVDDLPCDTLPALASNAAGELLLVWDHRDEVAGTWQLHARTFR
jgi:hypothetical protein